MVNKDLDRLDFTQLAVYGNLQTIFFIHPLNFIKMKNLNVSRQKSDAQVLKEIFPVQVLRVNSTKSVSWLKDVNRDVTPVQVSKLAESIQMMGITRPIVMAKLNLREYKGEYIIDGQHLFLACLRLNMDMPVRFIDIKSEEHLVETLAKLNNSSKPWGLADYVKSWSYIKPQYKTLKTYHNTYGLELQAIAGILHQSASIYFTNDIIKRGTLCIKNEDKSVSIMDCVVDILSIMPNTDRNSARKFVNAYVQYVSANYETYDHEKAIKNIKKNIKNIELSICTQETLNDYFYSII